MTPHEPDQTVRDKSMHRRIGLFGGTFDPPHLGHLVVADQVRSEMGLDECWLVVANDPWQKSGTRNVTQAATRLALVRAALGDPALDGSVGGLHASDVELEEDGPSYTIDTLATLQARHENVEWFVVVGQDAASRLDTWDRADELKKVANFVVVNRPGSPAGSGAGMSDGWHIEHVVVPPLDISSTDLRARFAAGRSVRFLVPDAVIDLVDELGIYRPQS